MGAGAEPDIFIWWGHWRASFATRGAVNGLCRTFRKRPEKFGGGSGTPLAPPGMCEYNICAEDAVHDGMSSELYTSTKRMPLQRF